MANEEHVARLKEGVAGWNAWRQANLRELPDVREADLRETHVIGANFSRARLSYANLRGVNLLGGNLVQAILIGADLSGANLSGADLRDSRLIHVHLDSTILRETVLSGANLSQASLHATMMANLDLRATRGLADIEHRGPSAVAISTILLPQDGSALHFLRGCGVPDEWIGWYHAQMMHPIHYHSCFISSSRKDEALARRLHADLQNHGVRCWFAPEDMKIGDKIRTRIDEVIHQQDKLLLLLSEHALTSSWVEDEVEAAFEKEQRQQREVLFPVRLDDAVMQTTQAWAAKLRRTRHIGDFTKWTDLQAYQQAFERLLRDLKKADE